MHIIVRTFERNFYGFSEHKTKYTKDNKETLTYNIAHEISWLGREPLTKLFVDT